MDKPPEAAATLSLSRIRQLVLIGTGWTIVALGVIVAPLPGPGGLPIILVGGVILLRNSADARRRFIRLKRRYPRWAAPIERLRGHLRRRRQA